MHDNPHLITNLEKFYKFLKNVDSVCNKKQVKILKCANSNPIK